MIEFKFRVKRYECIVNAILLIIYLSSIVKDQTIPPKLRSLFHFIDVEFFLFEFFSATRFGPRVYSLSFIIQHLIFCSKFEYFKNIEFIVCIIIFKFINNFHKVHIMDKEYQEYTFKSYKLYASLLTRLLAISLFNLFIYFLTLSKPKIDLLVFFGLILWISIIYLWIFMKIEKSFDCTIIFIVSIVLILIFIPLNFLNLFVFSSIPFFIVLLLSWIDFTVRICYKKSKTYQDRLRSYFSSTKQTETEQTETELTEINQV